MWAVRVTNRAEFGDIVRNLLHEIEQLDVEVRTGVIATAETVLAERPDAVIIATGSIPDGATILGAEGSGVADVTDILSGQVKPGKRGAVIDRLDSMKPRVLRSTWPNRAEVEVVTPALYVGQDLGVTLDLENWYRQARRLGIKCTPNHSVLSIQDGVVTALHNYSGQLVNFLKSTRLCWRSIAKPTAFTKRWRAGAGSASDRRLRSASRAHAAIIEGEKAGLSDGETHRCGGRNRTCRRTDSIDARMPKRRVT